MKLQYYTFFLNPVASLFEDDRSKIDILADILQDSEPINFRKRGADLAYVFTLKQGKYIVSKIGRKSQIKRTLSPEHNFEIRDEENWPFCNVIFFLGDDPEKGQKIAFEYKSSVFTSPFDQLKVFSEKLNETLSTYGYVISINPITEQKEFWNLVDENKGKIEKLCFTFNTPNLFNLNKSLSDDLKGVGKEFQSNRVSIDIENSDGKLEVPRENELVKQGVEYVARGGGEYALKIKGKARRVLKSSNNIVTRSVEIEDFEVEVLDPKYIQEVLDKIF